MKVSILVENFDVKNSLPYGDFSYKIVMNTRSPKKNTPPELIPFFDYMNNMKIAEDDDFIQKLQRSRTRLFSDRGEYGAPHRRGGSIITKPAVPILWQRQAEHIEA